MKALRFIPAALVLSFPLGHDRLSLRIWAMASLAVCVLPIAIWRVERRKELRMARAERSGVEIERLMPVAAEAPEPTRRLAGEAA